MKRWWQEFDQLLRQREGLFETVSLERLPAARLLALAVLLGVAYGFFMGGYGVFARAEPEYRQVLADMMKVPALFLLTVFICFPSMYVFSVLLGSQLSFGALGKALVVIVAIAMAVLASLGPIVAFFALSTENYPFMKLLNISFVLVAALVGLGVLVRALEVMLASASAESVTPLETDGPPSAPPVISSHTAAAQSRRRVNRFFRLWIALVVLVAAQMAWVLRPLVGDPDVPFVWFSPRESNCLVDLWNTLSKLFS